MTTILDRIVEAKRHEIEAAKQRTPLSRLREQIDSAGGTRDFFQAVIPDSPQGIQLIAEIKKTSPSAGLIVKRFDPVHIAEIYHLHGAAALSVLTDQTFFQGCLDTIDEVKRAMPLPVLRKDFILDAYQLYESRASGADAVLLIAEVLGIDDIVEFLGVSQALEMTTLIEVHTKKNLSTVMNRLGPPKKGGYLLGINNRDLTLQRSDLETTRQLASLLPEGSPFVSQSDIATQEDVLAIQEAGACAMLVGEAILRADDMGAKIRALLGHR